MEALASRRFAPSMRGRGGALGYQQGKRPELQSKSQNAAARDKRSCVSHFVDLLRFSWKPRHTEGGWPAPSNADSLPFFEVTVVTFRQAVTREEASTVEGRPRARVSLEATCMMTQEGAGVACRALSTGGACGVVSGVQRRSATHRWAI